MSDLFDQLPERARASVRTFQTYTVRRGSRPTAQRPGGAKRLLQDVAAEIAIAYELDSGRPLSAFEKVLPDFGVRLRVDRNPLGNRRGELVPEPGGFVATIYDPQEKSASELHQLEFQWTPSRTCRDIGSRERVGRRGVFTISHELAHVFFYRRDRPTATPRRIVPNPLSYRDDGREEGLCDDFAGAMLLPDCLAPALPANPGLSDLVAAWKKWFVPFETIVRRSMYDWGLANDLVVYRLRWTRGAWKPRPFWGYEYRRSRARQEKAAGCMKSWLASRVKQGDAMLADDIRNSLQESGVDSHCTGNEIWTVLDSEFLSERAPCVS